MPRLSTTLKDQRGVALVMSLIALLVLSTLIIAFSVMSATEPTIANNHMRTTEARAVAEAGIEQAIWALNLGEDDPSTTVGLPNPLPTPQATVPSPYNNQVAVPVIAADGTQRGVFRVTVTGITDTQRTVESVGWVPTDLSSDPRTKAHQKVRVTLSKVKFLDPPCALCVRGDLQIGGNTLIDSRVDTSCGSKAGSLSSGTTTRGGSADIYGADGNDTKNEATDILQNALASEFDQFTLTAAERDALRVIAKAHGTYYQGSVTFNSSNPMPNGIVFVDTVSGEEITGSTSTSDFAGVTIHGNNGTSTIDHRGDTYDNAFKGWLIVNGSLDISGNVGIFGMVYAMNDITYRGTGSGMIAGAVISQNLRDIVATSVDSTATGNAKIEYDCNLVKTGGGTVSQTWFTTSYREVQGQ